MLLGRAKNDVNMLECGTNILMIGGAFGLAGSSEICGVPFSEHVVLEMKKKKNYADFVLHGMNKKLFVFKDQNGCFSVVLDVFDIYLRVVI